MCYNLLLMKSSAKTETYQQTLWNNQHSERGINGAEGGELCNTPNGSAVIFANALKPNSTILEVGSANGRDARYWATEGHKVYALDFSQVALDQLRQLALAQNVQSSIIPILWDIAEGKLPLHIIKDKIDGFYARSALHVGDKEMINIAKQLNKVLKVGGKILIEGKGQNDKKIRRSKKIGRNLAVDNVENGHLRRIWTQQFIEHLCKKVGWDILDISGNDEEWNGTNANFVRLSAQKK